MSEQVDLEKLKALEAAASPGRMQFSAIRYNESTEWHFTLYRVPDGPSLTAITAEEQVHNGHWMAAAINALPALIAELEQTRAEIAGIVAEYGDPDESHTAREVVAIIYRNGIEGWNRATDLQAKLFQERSFHAEQSAELEQARAAIRSHADTAVKWEFLSAVQDEAVQALRAENARLRDALAKIERESCIMGSDSGNTTVHKLAADALAAASDEIKREGGR